MATRAQGWAERGMLGVVVVEHLAMIRAGSRRVNWFNPDATIGESASFDLLSTAVLLVDVRGRVVFANQAAELLFEVSRKHIAGQKVTRFVAQ